MFLYKNLKIILIYHYHDLLSYNISHVIMDILLLSPHFFFDILSLFQNMDFLEENKTSAYQHTSSNLLILKIKKEIERFNEELIETTKKINKYRSSLIFTKLKEINAENNLYEIQMKKIASLLNNALNIKEANEKKIQEMLSFEYNINIQNSIIMMKIFLNMKGL